MMTDNNKKDKRFSKLLSTIEKEKVLPDKEFLAQLRERSTKEFETYSAESNDHSQAKTISIWRVIMKSKITKFAAAAVILIAILIGINQFGGSVDGSRVAFGDVIEYFQTLSYTFDLTVEPIPQSSSQDVTPINAQAMVIQPQKLRLNWFSSSDGEVSSIVDYDAEQYLQLFRKNKVGRICNYNRKAKGDFSVFYSKSIEKLWDLKDGSETFLGEKELYGQTATGFKVIQGGFEIVIWADLESGLPLYVEALSEPNNSSVSTKWVMENFDFDVDLDEELFSLDGPAEYKIVDQFGKVTKDGLVDYEDKSTDEENVHIETVPEFLIKPHEGIGAVKFGMTREQIIEILGEPDQFLGKHCLDYSSTVGLSLLVHPKRGLLAIDCWSQDEDSDEGIFGGRDFAGKTHEGIGINSTKNEIIRQYGNEFEEYLHKSPDIFALRYPQLNTIFKLRNNKVIHISLDMPR